MARVESFFISDALVLEEGQKIIKGDVQVVFGYERSKRRPSISTREMIRVFRFDILKDLPAIDVLEPYDPKIHKLNSSHPKARPTKHDRNFI